MSKSDVYRRQIMTTKVDRHAVRVNMVEQISVIFNHLKLWVVVARHNFKWVKIKILLIVQIVGGGCLAD